MRSIDKKVWRDLWTMKGQALAIALVIMSGVATFVMSLTTVESLKTTQASYYKEYRLAEAFISLKRAPEYVSARVAELPGVEKVATRVVAVASIDIEDFTEPVTGRLVSIPDSGTPLLNDLFLREGRLPNIDREDEVVVSELFANAHELTPGDTLSATINGRKRELRVVGFALSPEYIYQIRPGVIIPDFKRYGIFWMARTPLSAAYDMEGGFNDLSLTLTGDAVLEDVIDRLDEIFEPYGGLGAYGRVDQLSNRYLTSEFQQLEQMATIFPLIFLSVAAFLLNIVVSRLVSTQREQIALLKAFGYSNFDVAIHYLKLVMLIVFGGFVCGVGAGVWLGNNLSRLYMDFYRFPFLDYTASQDVIINAALVCVITAGVGTIYAIRRAAKLPPAEAMRPEPPVSYRDTVVERIGLKRLFSQPSRMILRHIERRPVKSLLTIIGIAFSCAIMLMGTNFDDAVDYMLDVHFGQAERADMMVTFIEPTSGRAFNELMSMPGMNYGEPFRTVPARLSFEHRSYRTAVQGLVKDATLHRLLDEDLRPFDPPESGVVLTDQLGKMLGIGLGDDLTVEVLEGSRPTLSIPVTGFVKEYVGVSAYMEINALNRLMGEGGAISGAYFSTDKIKRDWINEELKGMPRVAGTIEQKELITNIRETMAKQIYIFTFFIIILAATISFGVVYNSARIALSERQRELASLRVLGFTRGEISYILLGELGLLTLVAIPIGFVIGRGLSTFMIAKLQTDLYRIPVVINADSYAFSAVVVLVSAVLSGLIVRDRLDHLDLVEALKTKE